MKRRSKVRISETANSLNFIDNLPATQEDNVVWDEDADKLSFAANTNYQPVEEEDNSLEFTSSFTWKEIHKSKKQKQSESSANSVLTQNFQDFLAEIGALAPEEQEKEQEDSGNADLALDISFATSTKSQVSIVLPTPSEIQRLPTQSQFFDTLDFELSEEYLQQIEEQANNAILQTENFPSSSSLLPQQEQQQPTQQVPTAPDFSSLDDIIEVPEEFLFMCDEMEKQAYATQAAYALSPISPIRAIASSSSAAVMNQATVSRYQQPQQHEAMQGNKVAQVISPFLDTMNLSNIHSNSGIRTTLHNPGTNYHSHDGREEFEEALFCMRLRVLDVQEDMRYHKKMLITQRDDFTVNSSRTTHHSSSSAAATALNSRSTTDTIFVELEEDWYNTAVSIGDKIHVMDIHGESTADHRTILKSTEPYWIISITNDCGILIVAPDTLVSPTKIAESCTCIRRGVITDRMRSFGNITSQAIMGNVRHMFIEMLTEKILLITQEIGIESLLTETHIFQQLLREDPLYLSSLIQLCVQEHIEELFNLTITDHEIERDLRSIITPLIQWILTAIKFGTQGLLQRFAIHVDGTGGQQSLQPKANPLNGNASSSRFEEVVGIEETIHSPMLGIKGQVDMIMGGKLCPTLMMNSFSPVSPSSDNKHQLIDSVVLPIELKTGMWRPSTAIAHRAQVILYILLMLLRERTSKLNITNLMSEVGTYGWLVYINQQELKVDLVVPSWLEIRSLLLSRNQLAKFIQDSITSKTQNNSCNNNKTTSIESIETLMSHLTLPPILNSSDCTYCYNTAECFLYHGCLTDDPNALSNTTSNVTSLYSYVLKGIHAQHLQYFKHWDRLIDLEYLACNSSNRKSSVERLVWQASDNSDSADSLKKNHNEEGGKSINYLKLRDWKAIGREHLMLSLIKISDGGNNSNSSSSANNTLQEQRLVHSLILGDRVQLSILRYKNTPNNSQRSEKIILQKKKKPFSKNIFTGRSQQTSSTTTTNSSSNSLHYHHGGRRLKTAMAPIHVNMCSGSIQSIQENSIELLITNGSKTLFTLLKQLQTNHIISLEDIGWCIRIDKDEMNIQISTMRSNLMELFVEPYNSKVYLNAMKSGKKSYNNENNNNNNNHAKEVDELISRTMYINSSHRQKIRELIVDLRAPQFLPLLSSSTAQQPFQPPASFRYSSLPPNPATWTATTFHEELLRPLTDLETIFSDLWLLWKPKMLTMSMYLGSLRILRQCLLNYRSKTLHSTTTRPLQLPLNDQYYLQTKLVSVDIHGKIAFTDQYNIYPGCYPWILYQEYFTFNQEQQECIHKILATQDYALIWGLPGSGKSTILVYILRILIARNEKILLTSYTHNAVDHLMDKLLQKGILPTNMMKLTSQSQKSIPVGMIRSTTTATATGVTTSSSRIASCIPEISQFSSLTSFREYIREISLFVSTISTVSRHGLMKTMKVDWCIVDEAGQLLQPMILGGILKAHKFVLVGDDYQLPPLVISKDAIAQGMDISLFKRLIDTHPLAMCSLTAQYRMNANIMSLCNAIVYEGRMKCGSMQIATARLTLPDLQIKLPYPVEGYRVHSMYPPSRLPPPPPPSLDSMVGGGLYPPGLSRYDWLYLTLLPANAVVFLNTDTIPLNALQYLSFPSVIAQQQQDASNITTNTISTTTNLIDAYVIHMLLWGLEQTPSASLTTEDIAIITPFRSQVQLLQHLINDHQHNNNNNNNNNNVTTSREYEISTVDRYQGKDKDVIILNTVKRLKPTTEGNDGDNNSNAIGYLLKDWRRINVALTRAKLKLIIVGSTKIMEQDPILQALLKYVMNMQWTLDLPPYACEMYPTR